MEEGGPGRLGRLAGGRSRFGIGTYIQIKPNGKLYRYLVAAGEDSLTDKKLDE